jgi:hypothetical protein
MQVIDFLSILVFLFFRILIPKLVVLDKVTKVGYVFVLAVASALLILCLKPGFIV